MARIAGINIPMGKPLWIALQYIYGIGPVKAKEICEKARLDGTRRVSSLVEQDVLVLREIIDRDLKVEGELRREVTANKKRLMDLGCYRGLRHRKNLPVRGQRTRTNARVRRGKRAVAIAGKK